jgi:uncharacterized membrane protein
MRWTPSLLAFVIPAALAVAPSAAPAQPAAQNEAARVEFFEKKVRPILVNNCYTCHSANTNARGGWMRRRSAMPP